MLTLYAVLFFVGIACGLIAVITLFAAEDNVALIVIAFLLGAALFFTGGIGWLVTTNQNDEKARQNAANEQGIIFNKDATSLKMDVYMVGNNAGCWIPAQFANNKFILAGADPVIVLTPKMINAMCG